MTQLIRSFGAPFLLFFATVGAVRREGLQLRECLFQIKELGTRSMLLISSGLAFFGVVLVFMAWAQARKFVGNVSVVGPAYFELVLREFAPMLVALLAASRAGAAISAELSSMSVNEQVEALELSAADPVAELVAPRLVAGMVTLPALTVIGTVAAALAAAGTVTQFFGADGTAFFDARLVGANDIVCAVTKAFLCGTFIPLVACSRGLRARGGAAAVGEAVTEAVVHACIGCLMIDFVVAAVFLLLGWL